MRPGLINVLGERLWDSSAWLPQDSIIGRLLHTLVGYTDRPTELQLITYLATLAIMVALTRFAGIYALRSRSRLTSKRSMSSRGLGRANR